MLVEINGILSSNTVAQDGPPGDHRDPRQPTEAQALGGLVFRVTSTIFRGPEKATVQPYGVGKRPRDRKDPTS